MQRHFLETGTEIGKYCITKALFMGGTGMTYLAQETGSRHAVVLKEYYPQDLKSVIFRDENGLLQPIREEFRSLLQRKLKARAEEEVRKNGCIHFDEAKSTNVAGTYRTQIISGETGGIGTYLVIETAAGETLAQWSEKNLETEKIFEITLNIAKTLRDQYHNRGYVHFDIRPENVYIEDSSDDRVVFLDLEYACECNGTLQEVNAYPYSSGFSCPELKKLHDVQKSQLFTGFGSLTSEEVDNAKETVNAAGLSIDTYSVAAMVKWMLADKQIPPYMEGPLERFFGKALGKAEGRFESTEKLIGELNKLLLAIRQKGYEPEVLRYNAYRNFDQGEIRIDPNLICQVKTKKKTYNNITEAVRAELLEDSKQSCMVLSAEGGAGKSFALLNCVEDFRPDPWVYPFLIPARNLENEDLLCYFSHTFAKAEISITQTEAERRFDFLLQQLEHINGSALLLIDGLDEISIKRRIIVSESVKKLLASRKDCLKVVLSSRSKIPGTDRFLQASLVELPKDRLLNMGNKVFWDNFPLPITPLIIVLLQEISSIIGDYNIEKLHIESKVDLMKAYFKALQKKAGAGREWIYSRLLPYIAHATETTPLFGEKAFQTLFRESASYEDFIFSLDDLVDVTHFPVSAAEKALFFKQEAMSSGLIVKADLQYYFNHLEKRDYLAAVYMANMASTDDDERDKILTKVIRDTAYYDEHYDQRRDLSAVDNSLTRCEYLFHFLCESIDGKLETVNQAYLSRLIELGLNLAYYLEGVQSYSVAKRLNILIEHYKYMVGNVGRILEGEVYYFFMSLRIPQQCFGDIENKVKYLEEVVSKKLEWTRFQLQRYVATLSGDSSELKKFQELEAKCLGNLGGIHLEKAKLLLHGYPSRAMVELDKAERWNLEGIALKKETGHEVLYRNYVALGTISYYRARFYLKMNDNENAKRCLFVAIDYHERSLDCHLPELTEGYRHVAYHNIGGAYRELCKIGSAEEQVVFAEKALSFYELEIQELEKRKELEKSKVSIIREIEKLDVDAKAFFNEQPEVMEKRNESIWRIQDNLKY